MARAKLIDPRDPIVALRGPSAHPIRTGDYVDWLRPRFSGGSFHRGRASGTAKLIGYERCRGIVIRHSYGKRTGQHTFSIVCPSRGKRPVLVKGRNLYGNLIRHVPNMASHDRSVSNDQ